jgi:aspartate dehydrogenase
MLSIAIIGCGAIGASVLELIHGDAAVRVAGIVAPPQAHAATCAVAACCAPDARVVETLDALPQVPDLLVECAGHAAIEQHVLPALERGIPCLVASIGALAEPGLAERIEAAARRGGTQVQLLSGAIGGVDALAAARVGGLDSVVYTGRKPPRAWKGTPAERVCDLDALQCAQAIFTGSAREAARMYPKNANVAATLSLAGIGLERTEVRLYADPAVSENVHHVEARGAFGGFELTMRGKPLAANPKTSALTVYSVVHALRNRARPVCI